MRVEEGEEVVSRGAVLGEDLASELHALQSTTSLSLQSSLEGGTLRNLGNRVLAERLDGLFASSVLSGLASLGGDLDHALCWLKTEHVHLLKDSDEVSSLAVLPVRAEENRVILLVGGDVCGEHHQLNCAHVSGLSTEGLTFSNSLEVVRLELVEVLAAELPV